MSILKAAEKQLSGQQLDQGEEKQIADVIEACLKKTKQLLEISKAVVENKGAGTWSTIKKFYKDAVRRFGELSKNRVEDQMKDIWDSLQVLATYAQFQNIGTLAELSRQLQEAMETLSAIAEKDPSLPEADCEDRNFTMYVSDQARGAQVGRIEGDMHQDTYGNSLASGPHATANIGTPDFLAAFLGKSGV